jgi:hypothetical protein
MKLGSIYINSDMIIAIVAKDKKCTEICTADGESWIVDFPIEEVMDRIQRIKVKRS